MGLGSGIRKKPIPDPGSGSRGQIDTGSRIPDLQQIPTQFQELIFTLLTRPKIYPQE